MEHHHGPDVMSVYHEYGRGMPRLGALCVDGLPEKEYLPGAIGDDLVLAWCLVFKAEVVIYSVDPGSGAILHCTLPDIDAARDYLGSLHDCELRVVWL